MALVEDAFETVAVTWSQPEAAVILSMFEFYGIPAYGTGRWHTSINPVMIMGLDGIHVRVHPVALDEALDLLAEASQRPAAIRPYLIKQPWLSGIATVIICVLGLFPVPPTRTASTFFLWKRRA